MLYYSISKQHITINMLRIMFKPIEYQQEIISLRETGQPHMKKVEKIFQT